MAQKKNSKVLKKVPEDENHHASCIRVSQSELLVDHDAELLDIEGDPLEEFEVTKSDKVDKVFFNLHIFKNAESKISKWLVPRD